MKASKYNIIVDLPETDEMFVYNSLSGSLTVFEGEEGERARCILADTKLERQGEEEFIRFLAEQGHLISDTADEVAIAKRRKKLGIEDANRLDLVIMPTLDCNFACEYCYETRRPGTMSDEIENAIKNWADREVPKYKVVMLHWFGGEPLICLDRVISITTHILGICAERDVLCVPHVTTNGYLLNEKRIRELVDSGIIDFQITVDGPQECHDKLRVLRNGGGTFDRVFRNIATLARSDERVKITLRVNFNHTNLSSIPDLLQSFPVDVRPHLRVVYEPIFGSYAVCATDNLPTHEISEAMTDYYKQAAELGYDVVLGQSSVHPGRLVYCYAEREHQLIVSYDGSVYKCSVSNFTPAESVGQIQSDGTFCKNPTQWNTWMGLVPFDDECYSCAYLPLCMGGCRRSRLENKGTGSYCALVPTNASYLLKQIALGTFEDVLRHESGCRESKLMRQQKKGDEKQT